MTEREPHPCEGCGQPLVPLDWDHPGFWYHPDGLLLCVEVIELARQRAADRDEADPAVPRPRRGADERAQA